MRRWWFIVITALALVAVAARVIVVVAGLDAASSRIPFNGLDVLAICLVAAVGGVVLMLVLFRAHRRMGVGRVRRMFPDAVVVAVSLRGEDARVLIDLSSPGLPEKARPAWVVLGADEIEWWVGLSPKRIARVDSELPIRYSRGRYQHLSHQETNVIADVTVSGRAVELPIIVVDESSVWPRRPTDEALDELIGRLAVDSTKR
ncbi:hypothetical protein ASE14_12755 [Agromyces sp. Root81]|uniref:hypothetical protein n=1 Tax=Agromyces sp. Root81 TaxID=1736601 RepID=UPI0007023CD0|nr:hypothetical protein [Agromyces sp. Root81]KRC61696.1 hypothetical protein ASE14_12755 [Agromyces sp. Root81]